MKDTDILLLTMGLCLFAFGVFCSILYTNTNWFAVVFLGLVCGWCGFCVGLVFTKEFSGCTCQNGET